MQDYPIFRNFGPVSRAEMFALHLKLRKFLDWKWFYHQFFSTHILFTHGNTRFKFSHSSLSFKKPKFKVWPKFSPLVLAMKIKYRTSFSFECYGRKALGFGRSLFLTVVAKSTLRVFGILLVKVRFPWFRFSFPWPQRVVFIRLFVAYVRMIISPVWWRLISWSQPVHSPPCPSFCLGWKCSCRWPRNSGFSLILDDFNRYDDVDESFVPWVIITFGFWVVEFGTGSNRVFMARAQFSSLESLKPRWRNRINKCNLAPKSLWSVLVG